MPTNLENQTFPIIGDVTIHFSDPVMPSITKNITTLGVTEFRTDNALAVSIDVLGESILMSDLPHSVIYPDHEPGTVSMLAFNDATLDQLVQMDQK